MGLFTQLEGLTMRGGQVRLCQVIDELVLKVGENEETEVHHFYEGDILGPLDSLARSLIGLLSEGWRMEVEIQAPNGLWYHRDRVHGSIEGMLVRTHVWKPKAVVVY
jgi:hypothetical protein